MSRCFPPLILFATVALASGSSSGSDPSSASVMVTTPVPPVPPTPVPPVNLSAITCIYPVAVPSNTDISTLYWNEADALAEVERLQGLGDYMDQEMGARLSTLLADSRTASANWVSNGCDSYDGSLCTAKGAPSPCCESTNSKYRECSDQDGVDGCFFCEQPSNAKYSPGNCDPETFIGASVCGKDSAGNEVPAYPMTNLNPDSCSTGGEYKLELEEDNGVREEPIDPALFYLYAANNWTNSSTSSWGRKVLGWSVVTNAANATDRATVVVDGSLGLAMSYKPQNNGAFTVQGSCRTHFFAFRPVNYATADTYGIYGGNVTVIGATNGGNIQSNTSGVVRMLNIENNGGNVTSTGGTDSFLGNVVSSGNIQFVGASATSRLGLYNVTATAGMISGTNLVSTLFYVETKTGVSIAIDQGSHQVWHTTNAGSLSLTNCTSATLYNVSNSGSVSAQCDVITAQLIRNSGAVNIQAEGATLNLSFVENSGSITITGNPVSASITVPAGTTVSVPSGVTVTYTGGSSPLSSESSSTAGQQQTVVGSGSSSSDVILFGDNMPNANGCHAASAVAAGLVAVFLALFSVL